MKTKMKPKNLVMKDSQMYTASVNDVRPDKRSVDGMKHDSVVEKRYEMKHVMNMKV